MHSALLLISVMYKHKKIADSKWHQTYKVNVCLIKKEKRKRKSA